MTKVKGGSWSGEQRPASALQYLALPAACLQGLFLIRIESTSPVSPALQADSLLLSLWGSPEV